MLARIKEIAEDAAALAIALAVVYGAGRLILAALTSVGIWPA